MSWSYSPELVAEFLEANYSDTERCALSSSTPTPDQYYSHGKPTEHSRLSRFGMTCEPLTDALGAELLTWFQAGSRARTSASQEKVQGLMESVQDSGEKWRGWLAKYDPDSCSWKTAQHSLLGDSDELLATFPRSGMTRGGLLWELPTLERPTSGTGFGCLLPTPVSIDAGSRTKKYAQGGTPLSLAVKMWPTPTCQGLNGGSNVRRAAEKRGVELEILNGGRLNPDWTEWLMGWPIGHTALKPSETDKSRSVAPQLGESLVEIEA